MLFSIAVITVYATCICFANGYQTKWFKRSSFGLGKKEYMQLRMSTESVNNERNDDFNPSDYIKVLNGAPSNAASGNDKQSSEFLSAMRDMQIQKYLDEEVYRKYPFENYDLPILPDHDNYYSGKYKEFFWHQNADQVIMYISFSNITNTETITKKDITSEIQAQSIKLSVLDKVVLEVKLFDKIVPDGSFWVIESDANTGEKYIQLDLEKRFRMINWRRFVFEKEESSQSLDERRAETLKKLFQANKGISKLTGNAPETIEEMTDNEQLMKMIGNDVNAEPQVIDGTFEEMEYVKNNMDDFKIDLGNDDDRKIIDTEEL